MNVVLKSEAATPLPDEPDDLLNCLQVLAAHHGRPSSATVLTLGERSIVFTGLRGVGKTALLWVAEESAEEIDWIAQSVEARSGLDFRAALADRAWIVLRRLEQRDAPSSGRGGAGEGRDRPASFAESLTLAVEQMLAD